MGHSRAAFGATGTIRCRTGFVLLLAVLTVAGSACSPSSSPRPTPTSGAHSDTPASGCHEPAVAPLPSWASSGFTDPPAHITGARNEIVAIPFGWPLHAPTPTPGRSNKILWVARAGSGPLHIEATEQATGQTFSVTLPDGPGPSLVDMPEPGCWRFALTWANNSDQLFVRYSNSPRSN